MSAQLVEVARRVLIEHRAQQDGTDRSVVNLPASALIELQRALALNIQSSARQVVMVNSEGFDVEAFEHVVWREAARAGRCIQRLYILPHRGFASDAVERQLTLDRDSLVASRVLIVGRIPQEADVESISALWILDDQVSLMALKEGENRDAETWTVTARPTDLTMAMELWRQIWELADDRSEGGLDLEEPLVLSADLLNGVAPVLCTGDHVDRDGCQWYHGVWQYLRLLNMVSTPTWHSVFYQEHLRAALSGRAAPRAIITGTADYSLLAYLHDAARSCAPDAEIQVIDLCPTPLFACQWYGKRAGATITTRQGDILVLPRDNELVDLVCSDAFLTRFAPDAVRSVISAWESMLRPGGSLVTTIRIHSKATAGRDLESAVRDFRERATLRAERWQPFLRRSPEQIGQMAEVYARRMRSHNLGDADPILDLLRTAAFEVRHAELGEVPGELYPTVYLRVACTKK